MLTLKGGRVLPTGSKNPQRLDIAVGEDGRISAIAPSLDVAPDGTIIELAGRLVVPGLVDAHQHLDKSRTRRSVSNPSGTLEGALAGYRAFAATVSRSDIMARAEHTIATCLARGTVAIRSHTNIDPETEVRGVAAMVEVRERCADIVTLQVVAHVTGGATRMHDSAKEWLEQSIAIGADVIGGVPAFSDSPLAFLDLIFALAERHGLPIDLHIDEHLNPELLLFDAMIERTRAHGMGGRVVASHSSALSALQPDAAQRIIESLAQAGIAVITLPAANLFLQGRDATALPPRGLTRIRELLAAGAKVAAGSDNIQDPFVPTGSGDLLEIARWTLLAGHLGLTNLGAAFDMVSSAPAAIIGLGTDWGIHKGARADLLITDAEDADDLVASGSLHRAILIGGRLVAGSLSSIPVPVGR
jgi:cytosine deaminase